MSTPGRLDLPEALASQCTVHSAVDSTSLAVTAGLAVVEEVDLLAATGQVAEVIDTYRYALCRFDSNMNF